MEFSLIAMLTEATCGEACWHAREDICHCSCGGKNHGCLRDKDGIRPVRTCKIDGEVYELSAVGPRSELYKEAQRINRTMPDGSERFKRVEKPLRVEQGGEPVWYMQYYYHWGDADSGSPARLKYPTKAQVDKWPELAQVRSMTRSDFFDLSPQLLWVRIELPDQAPIKIVDRETGLPKGE